MFDINGRCPNCNRKLPARMKDKVACNGCGKLIISDRKTAFWGVIFILVIFNVCFWENWLLGTVLILIATVITARNIKYTVVDE